MDGGGLGIEIVYKVVGLGTGLMADLHIDEVIFDE
jgi:hypothetical protein